jgi:hypothetical protein
MVRLAMLTLMLAGFGTGAVAEVHRVRPAPPPAQARRQADADRIATALEAANRYSQSLDQRQDAKRAVNAAEGAANWTLGMMIIGIIDTLITTAGVALVWFTLRECTDGCFTRFWACISLIGEPTNPLDEDARSDLA